MKLYKKSADSGLKVPGVGVAALTPLQVGQMKKMQTKFLKNLKVSMNVLLLKKKLVLLL